MKRILLSACLLILVTTVALGQPEKQTARWKRYTVKGEAFSNLPNPAVKEGKFVSMWMQLEYNFNLY